MDSHEIWRVRWFTLQFSNYEALYFPFKTLNLAKIVPRLLELLSDVAAAFFTGLLKF